MRPLLCLVCIFSSAIARQLNMINEWRMVKYKIPPGYPGSDSFRMDRSLINSVEVGLDRIFLAVPKADADNPASLVYIPKYSAEKDPAFEAYPNWDWHVGSVAGQSITNSTCDGFISVYKMLVDRCARLWVLDSGSVFSLSPVRKDICPPKLVAFDLLTHQEVRRIEFEKYVLELDSLLTNFAIDDTDELGAEPPGNCDVGHIYVVDPKAPAIIVVNLQTKEMWRHSDLTFYPQPEFGRITHATGESQILMTGIVGLDLSSTGLGTHRDLYYNALSSRTVYAVTTAALKNRPSPTNPMGLPVRTIFEKPSQSEAICYDAVDNSLIFSPFNETTIFSWSLGDHKYRILSQDKLALHGVLELQSASLDGDNIWGVSTRLAKLIYDTVNPNEVNQRVFRLSSSNSSPPRGNSIDSQFVRKRSVLKKIRKEPVIDPRSDVHEV